MKGSHLLIGMSITLGLVVLATATEVATQDKYTLKVPGGLAFSEFRGV